MSVKCHKIIKFLRLRIGLMFNKHYLFHGSIDLFPRVLMRDTYIYINYAKKYDFRNLMRKIKINTNIRKKYWKIDGHEYTSFTVNWKRRGVENVYQIAESKSINKFQKNDEKRITLQNLDFLNLLGNKTNAI